MVFPSNVEGFFQPRIKTIKTEALLSWYCFVLGCTCYSATHYNIWQPSPLHDCDMFITKDIGVVVGDSFLENPYGFIVILTEFIAIHGTFK